MEIRTIFLAGAGGSGNIGGESILLAIIKMLKERYGRPRFIISAWCPDRIRDILAPVHPDITTVLREGGGLQWSELKEADLFVVCGDIALSENVVSFLPAYWSLRTLTAKLAQVPVVFLGIEAENLCRPGNRQWVGRVMGPATAAFIVRNAPSITNLKGMGVSEASIQLGAEPSLYLEAEDWERLPEVRGPEPSDRPLIGFGLKDFYEQPFRFDLGSRRLVRRDAQPGQVSPTMAQVIEFTACLADRLIEKWGAQVVFIPHHKLDGEEKVILSDTEVARLIVDRLKHPEHSLILQENLHPFQVIRFYKRLNLAFSMRHHTNSFCLIQGVPAFGYGLTEKIVNFYDHLGRPEMLLDPRVPDWDRLETKIDEALSRQEDIAKDLAQRRQTMLDDLHRAMGAALP